MAFVILQLKLDSLVLNSSRALPLPSLLLYPRSAALADKHHAQIQSPSVPVAVSSCSLLY